MAVRSHVRTFHVSDVRISSASKCCKTRRSAGHRRSMCRRSPRGGARLRLVALIEKAAVIDREGLAERVGCLRQGFGALTRGLTAPLVSANYRFHNAADAVDAGDAVSPCPPLPARSSFDSTDRRARKWPTACPGILSPLAGCQTINAGDLNQSNGFGVFDRHSRDLRQRHRAGAYLDAPRRSCVPSAEMAFGCSSAECCVLRADDTVGPDTYNEEGPRRADLGFLGSSMAPDYNWWLS